MDLGGNLKRLRVSQNLTQEELADRCELSKGFISQVERNLTSPSIATLTDMLECLGSSLKAFFGDSVEEKIVFGPADRFEKEDGGELKGRITWLVPSAQKNRMEPILIELKSGGATHEVPPHDGEEFGYVLSGSVLLLVGEKPHRAGAGDSFCIHPAEPHRIVNAGKKPALVIWVSSPPSF